MATLMPLILQIGLWILNKWFVKNPRDRDLFINLVNAMRDRGLVDVKKRYQAEKATDVLEDRWNQIEMEEKGDSPQ